MRRGESDYRRPGFLHDSFVAGAALIGILSLLPGWLPLTRPARGLYDTFVNYYSDLPLLVLSILAFRAGARRAGRAPARRFMQLWAAGCGSWLLVKLLDLLGPADLSDWPGLSLLRVVGYLGFYVAAIAALEQRPDLAPGRFQTLRSLELRGAIVLAFSLFVYFGVVPAAHHAAIGRQVSQILLYLVLDGYLLVRLFRLTAFAPTREWKLAYGALLAAVALWAAADGVDAMSRAGIVSTALAGTLLDLLWLPPFLGLTLAAQWPGRQDREDTVRPRPGDLEATLDASKVPLAALAVALPVIHFALEHVGAIDPEGLRASEACAFGSFLIISLLNLVHENRMHSLNRELAADRVREADSASQAKSRFLATVSHELRTPLNGVLGATDLLVQTSLSEPQRRLADILNVSANALLEMVNDVLDFSRIEAGRLELENVVFDPREVLDSVVQVMGEPARRRHLDLACLVARDVPPALRGDPGRLRQVVMNLVSNAVKFTEKGEVVLRATSTNDGERVVLHVEVQDTGVGIPEEARSRIFDAFSQAESSTTRRFGGTGLGLAISRELVGLMGGRIDFESEPGTGTRFWVTVPLGRAPLPVPLEHAPARRLANLRVLIVDDLSANRSILQQQCGNLGLEARAVEGADDALDVLRAAAVAGAAFDVVILDRHMPGVDGLDLARSIKAAPDLAAVRLVLLTSGDPAEDEIHVPGLLDARVAKPLRESQLRECLEAVTGRSSERPPSRPSPAFGAAEPGAARGRVLLAEDNPVNQEVARSMLRLLGVDVEVASDGPQALRALLERRYDAVFMDCMMPGMDGFEVTAAFREAEHRSPTEGRTPIIALTASATTADRTRCLAMGMDDFVTKPFRLSDLEVALGRWFPAGGVPASRSTDPESAAAVVA